MPPKDYEPSQIFFKAEDGEYQTIGNSVELTEESENIFGDNVSEFLRKSEMSVFLWKVQAGN